ncbi:MAG: sugar phosphate isomerase/epimerase [Spirochaetales bacterium]|nr:sugar phosphate isomerase/epimerase [Spirochaetales bacterium]
MQNYEIKSLRIKDAFIKAKKKSPEKFEQTMNLSWSVWMFGTESIDFSLKRLRRSGLKFFELRGDHHTRSSGLSIEYVKKLISTYEMRISGTCGLFGSENDLSSNNSYIRQRGIDYIKREVEFLESVDGEYMIVVPSAVGRPEALDCSEFHRSVNSLRQCADSFKASGIKAAIEPIRSAEVSLINSVDQALEYIKAVDCESINHINADTYHMLLEESHIGETIMKCKDQLVNLHIADSNRDAPGSGMIDFDTVIMALYLIGFNTPGHFVTPEPLGPNPNPYTLMNELCDTAVMDELVKKSISYFREREAFVLSL